MKQRTEIEILSDIENNEAELEKAIRYQDAAKIKKAYTKASELGRELDNLKTPQLL